MWSVEDIVARELARVEVHIAAGDIGIAGVEQLRDDLDIIVDQARCGLDDVGALDVELLAVGEERVGIELGDLHDGLVLAARALSILSSPVSASLERWPTSVMFMARVTS